MSQIKKYEDVVEYVLEHYPITREDDTKLYVSVCKQLGFDVYNISLFQWASEHKVNKWPAFTSINRARLLVEARRPELVGKNKQARLEKAEKIKEEMR